MFSCEIWPTCWQQCRACLKIWKRRWLKLPAFSFFCNFWVVGKSSLVWFSEHPKIEFYGNVFTKHHFAGKHWCFRLKPMSKNDQNIETLVIYKTNWNIFQNIDNFQNIAVLTQCLRKTFTDVRHWSFRRTLNIAENIWFGSW